MTPPSSEEKTASTVSEENPTLGQYFNIKWTLGNALSCGVGISLPILLADWQLANSYTSYGILAFLTFCFWMGLAQWLILRQAMPVSRQWMLNGAISPIVSAAPPLFLALISPFAFFLVFITYPTTNALLQWQVLRRTFRPARSWIVISLIASLLSSAVALPVGIISGIELNLQPGLATLLGGGLYGLLYGVITQAGLRRLMRQGFVTVKPQNKTGLDVPPTAKTWQITILTVLSLAVVNVLWLSLIPPLPTEAISRSTSQWLLPFYIFGLMLTYTYSSTLIHELGHLAFALTQGFDLRVFAVDRWMLVRRGSGWKVFRARKKLAGGFIMPVFRSLARANRRSLALMILGGPTASFLLFCVGAVFLLSTETVSGSFSLWLFVALSAISLHMAIFNILPLQLGYLKTDGRRILDLAQNNLSGQRYLAFYRVSASLRQGIRPKDLDPTFIEQVLAVPEQSTDHICGLLVAYSAALDEGSLEKAGHLLDRALDLHLHFPEVFRGLLLVEGAYFEAFIRHRAESARGWFEKITERALIPPYALLRAEAALLLAEGDKAGAQIKAEQGLKCVRRDRFMKGEAIAEEDYLLDLIQSIE